MKPHGRAGPEAMLILILFEISQRLAEALCLVFLLFNCGGSQIFVGTYCDLHFAFSARRGCKGSTATGKRFLSQPANLTGTSTSSQPSHRMHHSACLQPKSLHGSAEAAIF